MGSILTFILTFCVVMVVLKIIAITLILSWWMIVMVAILGLPAVLIILALNFII